MLCLVETGSGSTRAAAGLRHLSVEIYTVKSLGCLLTRQTFTMEDQHGELSATRLFKVVGKYKLEGMRGKPVGGGPRTVNAAKVMMSASLVTTSLEQELLGVPGLLEEREVGVLV